MQVIRLGGDKYFKADYKRFFCEGEDKHYIQEVKLQILNLLVNDENFDDIFNELSSYIHESDQLLAHQSIMLIGGLGKKF